MKSPGEARGFHMALFSELSGAKQKAARYAGEIRCLSKSNKLSDKMVGVQATKESKERLLFYGRKSSRYKMAMQVSPRIHAQISKKDHIQTNMRRHTGNHQRPVQIERCGDYRRAYDARPHPSTCVNSTQV